MKTLVSTIALSTMLALPAAAASLSLSGGTLSTIPGGTATNEALAPLSLAKPTCRLVWRSGVLGQQGQGHFHSAWL